jgi:hypothetical protein
MKWARALAILVGWLASAAVVALFYGWLSLVVVVLAAGYYARQWDSWAPPIGRWGARTSANLSNLRLPAWRKCTHSWELVEKHKMLGGLRMLPGGHPGYHYMYVYRCSICGATKIKNDRYSVLDS